MTGTQFPFSKFYDKLVEQGGYFNYPLIADIISDILEGKTEILELCIGTGNIAIPLAKKGFKITGIDNDKEMLELLKVKTTVLTLIEAPADNFNINKKFDAIYIHSGHLIFNVHEKELFLNVETGKSMIDTFKLVSEHLKPSGLFLINIERWNDCTIKLSDESFYQRTIIKEDEKEGIRLHIFYNDPTKEVCSMIADLQTRISYDVVKEELAKLGFSNFTNYLDTFFLCTFNNSNH
jgi:methyltransferase family protein